MGSWGLGTGRGYLQALLAQQARSGVLRPWSPRDANTGHLDHSSTGQDDVQPASLGILGMSGPFSGTWVPVAAQHSVFAQVHPTKAGN